jgi:hypothetical protein
MPSQPKSAQYGGSDMASGDCEDGRGVGGGMTDDEEDNVTYKGWRIAIKQAQSWMAFVYPPGTAQPEATFPGYPYRYEAIAEAKRFIDEWSKDRK